MKSKKNLVFLGMMGSGKSSIELFPEPIIPKKTRFFFDFISLNIEKTQICLNLKLTKVICNSTKIQVRAKKV